MQQFFGLVLATFLAFFMLMAHGLPTINVHLKRELEDAVEGHADPIDDTIGKLPGVGSGLSGVGSGLPGVDGDVHAADELRTDSCDIPIICDLPGTGGDFPGGGDLPIVGDLPTVD